MKIPIFVVIVSILAVVGVYFARRGEYEMRNMPDSGQNATTDMMQATTTPVQIGMHASATTSTNTSTTTFSTSTASSTRH